MKAHGMPFSTYDRDNDAGSFIDCANYYKAGWWFNMCNRADLNGQYYLGQPKSNGNGTIWYTWKRWESLKSTPNENKACSIKCVHTTLLDAVCIHI